MARELQRRRRLPPSATLAAPVATQRIPLCGLVQATLWRRLAALWELWWASVERDLEASADDPERAWSILRRHGRQ
jgi:hypothetical protein